MKTQTKLISLVAVVAIAAGATFAGWQRAQSPQAQFIALAGGNFSTADLQGKVVLVNFWATTCVTCVAEMPKMVETWRRFAPRGYEMVAVAMSYDHPNAVAEFAQRRALPFRVALDTGGAVARAFGNVSATPTTYLLDRRGRILATYVGEPDWQDLYARLDRALGT
ncbi:MAG TPA: TlpA disulfide reductase family protein [Burkholderiales bacterium]|nr:TlpA disulfide reductase family protein [Burkholderiales bacterium]